MRPAALIAVALISAAILIGAGLYLYLPRPTELDMLNMQTTTPDWKACEKQLENGRDAKVNDLLVKSEHAFSQGDFARRFAIQSCVAYREERRKNALSRHPLRTELD